VTRSFACLSDMTHVAGAAIMRLILLILIILLAILQYRLWSSSGGVAEVWRLQRAIDKQQQEILTLKERNRTLDAEVKDLKRGVAAIEERARRDLGMIKKGETYYQTTDE